MATPLYATAGQGFYTGVTHLKYSDGSNEGFKFYLENIPLQWDDGGGDNGEEREQ